MKPPTDSQWAAVRACDEHVLVEAGAGTGKTFTVVNRILYLLGVEIRGHRYAQPVTLADIVAITFTRQAAADLRRDLRAALREAGRRSDAHLVDQARIGTIHSFCSDLVREHTLRAGRAPLTGVLDEGEALAWAEGSVRDELLAALEAHDVDGLDTLLGSWDTGKVEAWTLQLMREEVLSRLTPDGHSPEERALIELARRALRRVEERLAHEGTIDYDRMIAWTRDLLRDEAGVRTTIQRRTHTLILDEFQDTDPVQREIAYLLAEPESGRRDTPRLMLVGDPKQSIYRFRGADVTVWSGVRRDFEEHGYGTVLRLTDNFRSGPSILSLVEATAGQWLNTPVDGDDLADYEVRFEPVDAFHDDVADPAIEFVVIPPNDDGKARNAESRRELEAAAVAKRLVELNQAGTPWRDMALLLRSWTSTDIHARAMRAAGIPVYALRDDNFLETREVLDLVVALRAIRDPRDDLAVFGFLRSPFVNLRDDTLLAIAISPDVRRPYARGLRALIDASPDALPETLPERERVGQGITLLHELAELRDRVPAATLLDELLHRTGYLAHLAMLGDRGAQAALNVRRFLQMVGGMEESSVGMVLRAIADRRAREDRVPQARLHGEQDDVLLITSIHMAKGLDWSVVVYGDLGAGEGVDSDKLQIGRDRIRLGEPETEAKLQPERWQELRNLRALEEDAEEKRVVYVGLTRPKHRLILAGIPQGSGVRASLARDMLEVFPTLADADDGDTAVFAGLDGIARGAHVIVAEPTVPESRDVADDVRLPDEASSLPHVTVATSLGLTRHSATELLSFSRCERRHALKYVYGIREPRPEGLVDSGTATDTEPVADAAAGADAAADSAVPVPDQLQLQLDPIARGQIVHDVLERHDWEAEQAEIDALLEDAIGRWDEHAPPPDTSHGVAYRTELSDEITRVLEMPEYAAVAKAAGARRELTFLHVLDDGAAMQGAIDIAAPSPADNGVTLADVKTSNITAGQAQKKAAEYAPQQDVYVAAASAIGPLPVREFGFIFSRPGVSVGTPVEESTDSPASADAASVRVRETLYLMGSVPFRMAASPRECFMCGYRKVGMCPGVKAAVAEEAVEQHGSRV